MRRAVMAGWGGAVRRILLVDDHPTFRAGMRLVLRELPDCEPLLEAGSIGRALACLQQGPPPDLVLYDWKLPDGGGVRGLLAVRQSVPQTPVIVMSGDVDEAVRLAARQLGAADYLDKSAESAVLLERIAQVLDSADALDPAKLQSTALDAGMPAPPAVLSRRQTQVLRHLANGDRNKEIARHMGISSLTVRSHVAKIMAALDVHNRTQAVVTAITRGLLQTKPGPEPPR